MGGGKEIGGGKGGGKENGGEGGTGRRGEKGAPRWRGYWQREACGA